MSGEEEEEEEEAPAAPAPRKVVKAAEVKAEGLDDESRVLLQDNANMRAEMAAEIDEMRARSVQRKREREDEEKRLSTQRNEEDKVRKEQEDERRRTKDQEESKRKEERIAKLAEFEKLKNPSTPNFVIKKKDPSSAPTQEGEDEDEQKDKKSKEQLEAEKQAILSQRIKPLEIDGFDQGKLGEKAKELYKELFRLECDKYDLEKRFKEQQFDMMELAERARSVNKVGKGGLKRVQLGQDESDPIQDRFASAPAKVVMFSQFERQKDKRIYKDRKTLFTGPVFALQAAKIQPERRLIWSEQGLPQYEDIPESEGGPAPAAAEEE